MSPYSILDSNFLSCTRKRQVKHTELNANTCYIYYTYKNNEPLTLPLLYIYNPPLIIAIMIHLYRQNGTRDECLLILHADPSRRYCFMITIMLHTPRHVNKYLVLCYTVWYSLAYIPVR